MARMIPPYVSDEVKSRGERQIFDLFKNDPDTRDWVVLHSLGLSQHSKRLYGEIDFLVLAPGLGIFCLEVKSGEVKRVQGVWQFTNRFGRTNTKPYGPFDQAREGMFTLMGAIKKKFGSNSDLSRLIYGYGVMFPHITFTAEGVDQEQWQIYDRRSRRFSISDYIKQLAQGTQKKVKDQGWFDPNKSLPGARDVEQLLSFLRGDFEKLVTPQQQLGDTEQQLQAYTEEQYHCLDQLRDNPRCLFRGAAGTGKTMIALESTRRHVFEKQRTLFVCYNVLLGNWLAAQFSPTEKGLTVSSFHRFLTKLSSERYEGAITNSDEYFKYDLPLMALDAIDRGEIEPFDHLIIDEGQDLLRPEYLDVFDALLKGGLAGGNWEIYCDFERQAIYADLSADEMYDLLEQRASFARFRLTTNCRNTRPIGEETSLLSGFKVLPFLPSKIEGLPVEYFFYKDEREKIHKLKKALRQLRHQSITSANVTILSPLRFENTGIDKIKPADFQIVDLTQYRTSFRPPESITFSTIHSFKGLENSYIILTDIDRLGDDEFKAYLYIGMSRARVSLYLLLNEHVRQEYNALLKLRLE